MSKCKSDDYEVYLSQRLGREHLTPAEIVQKCFGMGVFNLSYK